MRRRRRVVAAVAGLVVVAAAAVAVVVATRSSGGPAPVSRPDALVALDAASGAVRDVVPLPRGQRPAALVVARDGVWVALAGAYDVVRVDPRTRQITETVSVGGVVNGLAASGGAIWATLDTGRSLLRIDPVSGQIGERPPVANGPGAIAVANGSLWIASRLDGTVSRFDIARDRVTGTIPIGAGVTAVVAAFGSVWASSAALNSVTRIDAATGAVSGTIPVGHSPVALAASRDSIWVANRSDGTVSRIDPVRDVVIATVPVGRSPGTVAASTDGVLVADDDTGSVYRLTPSSSAATRVETLHAAAVGLVATGGTVLVTTVGLPSSHRGGVLRMAANPGPESSMDPALDNENPSTWVWDTLDRYPRTAGSVGYDVLPDLAEAIPLPSDGGRTDVFHIRRGIRYSTGVEVKPSDFVRAFYRMAVGRFKFPGDDRPRPSDSADAFTGIVGFQACIDKPATCDLSRGVVADDAAGTVTFHLDEPDADFIRSLASTPTAPVPPGTAVNGSWDRKVPGTGPYLMASQTPNELIERRNPYFHVWSPEARPDGNPDEIDWLLGNERPQQVALVESGRADAEIAYMTAPTVDRLLRQYPSQVFSTPTVSGLFPGLSFDPRHFPLSSRDVRRAINYAIDRSAITRTAPFTSEPTCQTIRPGVAGYLPYCPYTVDGSAIGAPDIAKARALVRRAGANGARVRVGLFGGGDDPNDFPGFLAARNKLLLKTLRAIGLRPIVTTSPNGGGDRSQIHEACCDDTDRPPAASELASITADCDPQAIHDGAFCDAKTKRLTDAANAETDPVRQARDWTALDRHLTDEAAWLPLWTSINVVFLGKGVSNYGQQEQLGRSLWELLTVR